MISEEEVKVEIDAAEKILLVCFDFLLGLKRMKGEKAEVILEFQPQLAECLYNLMCFYKKLKAERKRLISQKAELDQEFFREVMSCNDDFIKAIKHTIEIGKSLGDAFAWFFYNDNLVELSKHFQHKPTGLFAAGIGGRGEIEFIKNNQNFKGLFVLYHSMTSILRVGDFSLYGVGVGIVGIGELKTEKLNKKLIITAHISSTVNLNDTPNNNSKLRDIKDTNVTAFSILRLKRQLETQDELLLEKKNDENRRKMNKWTEYEYGLLKKVVEDKAVVVNEDSTLLLIGVKSEKQKLFQVLMEKEGDFKLPDGFRAVVEKTVIPDSNNNAAIIGTIDTVMRQSRIPILWWNIDDEICREIYFNELQIITLFNPAYLIDHFTNAGYSYIASKEINKIKLQRIKDAKKIEIENFALFFDLISHSLMRTQHVIDLISQSLGEIENGNYKPNSKINILLQPHTFGKMP